MDIEQLLLFNAARPWYGLFGYAIDVCFVLMRYFNVRIWDGDGFIDVERKDKPMLTKTLLCVTVHFDEDAPSMLLLPFVNQDGKCYVATKFMAMIYQHVYGGVIKYDITKGSAYVFLYDNAGTAIRYTLKDVNMLTILLMVVCSDNFDKNFGYDC